MSNIKTELLMMISAHADASCSGQGGSLDSYSKLTEFIEELNILPKEYSLVGGPD